MNEAWDSEYAGFASVPFPSDMSGEGVNAGDWSDFVYRAWPRSMLELPTGYDREWRSFLESRLSSDDGIFADLLKNGHGMALVLPLQRPEDALMDVLWCDFVESGAIPFDKIHLATHEERFGPFLRSNYLGGDIVSLNEEWHTSFEKFSDVPLPLGLSDLSLFPAGPEELRNMYASSAWFAVLRLLRYPAGVVLRTAVSVVLLAGGSLLAALLCAYALARLPIRSWPRLAAVCVLASVMPLCSWLAAGSTPVSDALGTGRWLTLAVSGASMLTVLILRTRFHSIIADYREAAAMEGVGEFGFICRFVVRYSWHWVLYSAVIHFITVYSAVDWQVLSMGRLWNWTIGVWVVNQGAADPSVKAAVALLGMLPVICMAALLYPVITRYGLVPIVDRRRK
jgi:ABC-type glycerol-3-phosphate transport system permease component